MRATFWGVRGSVPVPGPATERFGGNTSCVQVSAANGAQVVLDAGTGIRELGVAIAGRSRRLHILLTHLHLDHIQGLMFFAPFFDPRAEITVWGPPAAGRELRKRLARYISNPLSPIEIGDLPAQVSFRDGRNPGGSGRWKCRQPSSPTVARRSATGSPRTAPASAICPTTSRPSART
jgi:phosphoribosyl 1,2-cyclic phosphodiesterase